MNTELTIEQACAIILGSAVSDSIIAEMGVHWAVVAATAAAKLGDDSRALDAIRKHNARTA